MKKFLLLICLILPWAGCNILEFPFYVLFGSTSTTVKAEYTGLKNKRVALVVSGQPGIDFEYPYARMDVALASAQVISRHVENVTFVEQEKIDKFQQTDFDWYVLPMSEIADKFDAQQVLYLELIQFTLVETDSVNLLRGRIEAHLRVYDRQSPQPDIPSYETDIGVIFPEHGPVPMSDSARMGVQQQSLMLFAEALARRFYKHKIPNK
jgi:hypothetical protein